MIAMAQLMGEDALPSISPYATPRDSADVQTAAITAASRVDIERAAELAAPLVIAGQQKNLTRRLLEPLLVHPQGGAALAAIWQERPSQTRTRLPGLLISV